MAERAMGVDHSTVHRWVVNWYRCSKRHFASTSAPWAKAGASTKSKPKARENICIALWSRRATPSTFYSEPSGDNAAAQRLFDKAIAENGTPETVVVDKSTSNLEPLHAVNAERETLIEIRQVKYLNDIVEQDHRAIKRITRPMVEFKDFDCARVLRSGIKVTHMIKKGADDIRKQIAASAADHIYPLIS